MITIADQFLVLVLLINFILLGTGRLVFSIRAVAAQGVVLAILPGLMHPFSWHLVVITVVIFAVKGFVIPLLLSRATRSAESRKEASPFLGYVPTLLLGAVFTAFSFAFAGRLPMLLEHQNFMFVPASIATIMAGFLLLTTRRKAISQVLGYLVLENGIFIFGLLLAEAMPLMVEAGVLLDLVVATFIMVIVINQISREFSSLDTSLLTSLKEE